MACHMYLSTIPSFAFWNEPLRKTDVHVCLPVGCQARDFVPTSRDPRVWIGGFAWLFRLPPWQPLGQQCDQVGLARNNGKHNTQNNSRTTHDRMMTRIPLCIDICVSWLGVICLSPGLRDFCSARQNPKIQLACGPFAPLLGTFLAVSAHLVATKLHILFDAPRHS